MNDLEKPQAAALCWQRLETRYPYDCRMFRVREDLVRWPGGQIAPYAYVEGAGAVWIVPLTVDHEVVLIRQFRYTLGTWCWEVPAGGFHDFSGTPIELAQEELRQEVGGISDDWCYVGSFHPGTSVIAEVCHIVLARAVRLEAAPQRETGELIEVHPVSAGRALEMARSGEMADGHSALAVLRCEPHLVCPGAPGRT